MEYLLLYLVFIYQIGKPITKVAILDDFQDALANSNLKEYRDKYEFEIFNESFREEKDAIVL